MRSRYGARSEKLDPDQLQLALEEVAQSLGLAQSVVESDRAERRPARRPETLEARELELDRDAVLAHGLDRQRAVRGHGQRGPGIGPRPRPDPTRKLERPPT